MVRQETLDKFNRIDNFHRTISNPSGIFARVSLEEVEEIETFTNHQLETIYLSYLLNSIYCVSIYDCDYRSFLENEMSFRQDYFTEEKIQEMRTIYEKEFEQVNGMTVEEDLKNFNEWIKRCMQEGKKQEKDNLKE